MNSTPKPLQSPPSQQSGPLDQLRWLIEQSDSLLGGLERRSPADAQRLLTMLDDMRGLYTDLARGEVDLRAESTRIETIELTLKRKANVMLRLLGKHGGIVALRGTKQPGRERWWWYLDEYVAAERKSALRSLVRGSAILLVLFALAAVAYQTFLRPDPAVIAHMDHIQDISNAVEAADLDAALAAADKGLVEFPDDGEMLIWRGAVLTLLKRTQEADAAFDAARLAYADEAIFLVERATIRTRVSDFAGAGADALAAIALSPDSAEAYLVLGGAQELGGDRAKAMESYQTAASLAATQKNTQLEAMAKVRMAMMLQTSPINVGTTP